MSFEVSELQREFRFTHQRTPITLSDPDPGRSPEQVMQFYANQYPELTTSTVRGPRHEGDKVVYEFSPTIGTKG